ncbi:MAG: hypothetical protein GYA51_08325 [Candidatus Methanofastidiosa archaeon]|jgi:hypothetical protein|nr:hypothetical protein [Candidatus Methanofastidiosa archaeon]
MNKILIAIMILVLTLTLGCASSSELIVMKYQPMQCVQTEWEIWYAEGNIQFIKAPTDSEFIIAYYNSVHNIELTEVKKVESGNAVCEACGVCATSYYYTAKVKPSNLTKMTELKWTKI